MLVPLRHWRCHFFFFSFHIFSLFRIVSIKNLQPKLDLCRIWIQIVPSNWRSQGSPKLYSIFQCSACSRSCTEYSCWVFGDSGADFTWEVSGFQDTSWLSSVLFLLWSLILTVFGRANGEEKFLNCSGLFHLSWENFLSLILLGLMLITFDNIDFRIFFNPYFSVIFGKFLFHIYFGDWEFSDLSESWEGWMERPSFGFIKWLTLHSQLGRELA